MFCVHLESVALELPHWARPLASPSVNPPQSSASRGLPSPSVPVHTSPDALPPLSSTEIAASRLPSRRSDQLSAIRTPSVRTYGPDEGRRRAATAVSLVESQALKLPSSDAEAAVAAHSSSAPCCPPRAALCRVLVTKTTSGSGAPPAPSPEESGAAPRGSTSEEGAASSPPPQAAKKLALKTASGNLREERVERKRASICNSGPGSE